MCIVQTYTYGSATVKTRPISSSGVVEAGYFGVFTDAAVENLVGRVVEDGTNGRVLIVRMDRAIVAFTKMSEKAKARFAKSRTPGCVVCRPDQYEAIRSICLELSASGVMRIVFLDYQQAREWAEHLALAAVRHELSRTTVRRHQIEEQNRLMVVCQKDSPANQQSKNRLAGH